MSRVENLAMLQTIAEALENINEKFVFVGGATTALYVGEDAITTSSARLSFSNPIL